MSVTLEQLVEEVKRLKMDHEVLKDTFYRTVAANGLALPPAPDTATVVVKPTPTETDTF